eukprot:COSAG06_NODE_43_length_29826_cov_32.009621_14_plen_281_part_00
MRTASMSSDTARSANTWASTRLSWPTWRMSFMRDPKGTAARQAAAMASRSGVESAGHSPVVPCRMTMSMPFASWKAACVAMSARQSQDGRRMSQTIYTSACHTPVAMNGAQDRSTWEPEPFPPRNGAKLSMATRLIGWRGKISSIVAIVGARAQAPHHYPPRCRACPVRQQGRRLVAQAMQGQWLLLMGVGATVQMPSMLAHNIPSMLRCRNAQVALDRGRSSVYHEDAAAIHYSAHDPYYYTTFANQIRCQTLSESDERLIRSSAHAVCQLCSHSRLSG